ncbi:MAG: hypothetical protein HYV63_07675 [Candidatus Schekmanbacteria bacterium]|nr:hypothetical protein [Candidatus Schekmanbacteria bacterium]
MKARSRAAFLCLALASLLSMPANGVMSTVASAETFDALPAESDLTGLVIVRLLFPPNTQFRGFELGHKLLNDAHENPVMVRRFYWKGLADALNSVNLTPEGQVSRRRVGGRDILIQKTPTDDGQILASLYLPQELVNPRSGRFTLGLQLNFERARSTTRETTTFPVAANAGFRHETASADSFETRASFARTYIQEKEREGLRDQNGDLIEFRDLDGRTLQDSRQAALELGYYFNLARESSTGKVDIGITAGSTYDQDEINYIQSRLQPYLGSTLRFTAETIDDLNFELSVRLGGNFEKLLIVNTTEDESGNTVTTTTVEENRLPTVQLAVSGQAPLYRLNHITMILVKSSANLVQSLQKTDSGSGRPEKLERLAGAELGITATTPIGAELGLSAKFAWSELPGEASERIDTLQWNSSAMASITMTF